MVLKIYEGCGEILVFPVDASGKGIGEEAYFEDCERNREDFDVKLVEPPLWLKSDITCESERVIS